RSPALLSSTPRHDALPICDRQQLHDIAEIARKADIRRLKRIDAFDVNVFLADAGVEREGREDRQLLGGIAAGDVEGRIGFGKARSEEHTSELQSREKLVCR